MSTGRAGLRRGVTFGGGRRRRVSRHTRTADVSGEQESTSMDDILARLASQAQYAMREREAVQGWGMWKGTRARSTEERRPLSDIRESWWQASVTSRDTVTSTQTNTLVERKGRAASSENNLDDSQRCFLGRELQRLNRAGLRSTFRRGRWIRPLWRAMARIKEGTARGRRVAWRTMGLRIVLRMAVTSRAVEI
ncbi:hypothetical protein K438DRAFT_1768052 [Mycena galopus ATCC 62051]|nr:hypothetical protein K438DRAFT_1768052 [Mycena galopus ATCC 62051]